MDFLEKLENTARNNAEALVDFKDFSSDEQTSVCDAFVDHLNEISFDKIMCFLHVCYGLSEMYPTKDKVTRSRLQDLFYRAKAHKDADRAKIHRLETRCIADGLLPHKSNEDIIEDDGEPLLKRFKAMVQDVQTGETITITTDDGLQIQVKKSKE